MANKVYDPEADEQRAPAKDSGSDQNTPSGKSDPRGKGSDSLGKGGLRQAEDSGGGGGLYNAGGGNPRQLKGAEESAGDDDDRVGQGYKPEKSNPKQKRRFRLTKKKAVVGVGVSGLVSLAFSFFSISSGPLQLIHLDEILKKNLIGSNDVSSIRLKALYRYWKSGDIGETRVGSLGSKVVGRTLSQLHDVGIDFQRDSLGQIKSATIDTGKLNQSYPELDGMNTAERQAFLADTFGLSQEQFAKIGHGTKFAVNTRDFGVKATRALAKNSLAALDNGDVVTGIKFRVLAKFFNLPSLFHPMERGSANAQKKLVTKAERAKAEEDRQKAIEAPVEAEALPAEASLKSKLSGQNILTGALLLTTGMCLIRSVSGDVVAVNRAAIVVPSAVHATDKIAFGEQVKSGRDFSATQAGGVADSLVDSNGKTIWQGQALQALAGEAQSGPNLPFDYKQAFSNDTTAQHIKDAIGGGTVGDIACSTPGLIIQGVAGVALAAGSIIAAIPSGGASVAAEIVKAGVGAGATAGAIYLIQQQGTNLLSDKAILPTVFSGPLGGNLLAYGARETGNIGSRPSGAVPLNNSTTATLDKQQQLEDQKSFQSESFFARTFDTKDYRSLTGRLADSVNPNLTQNVASVTSSFLNMGRLIPQTLSSIFLPKTQADPPPYDWGFSKDGIPPEVLNDPKLANPYDNSSVVATLLDSSSGQGYIDRAKSCFGDDVSKGSDGWDATPTTAVNPNSDDYTNAHCGDISDYNWRRMIMFVSDTQTMKAAACYQGDDQACADVGFGAPAASTSTAAPTTGSLNVQAAQQAAQQASTGGAKVGFALYDSTGKQLGKYNETTQNYSASITKSMLLVAYLKQVGSGTLSSEDKTQLTAMIENSDNCAANWVFSHLHDGPANVNAVATQAGMTGFGFDDTHDTGTCAASYKLGQSKITADDFAKFFSKIDTYMPASQKTFGMDLLSHLSSTDQNGLLQAGLPGTVYSKEGWKPEPSGLEGSPYIVNQAAQFSSNGTVYGIAVTVGGTTDQPSGEAIVLKVGKALMGAN